MASKIRQNDEVIVLAGKDKGKIGKVKKNLYFKSSRHRPGYKHSKKESEAFTIH